MVTALTSVPSQRGLLVQHAKECLQPSISLCYEQMSQSLSVASNYINLLKVTAMFLSCCVNIKTSFPCSTLGYSSSKTKSRLMQNKDLVSCCLTYGANAKKATLPYLSLLESKCESEYQKGNLPIQKMLYVPLGCYILLRTYVPTQNLFSGLLFTTVSAEPLNSLV